MEVTNATYDSLPYKSIQYYYYDVWQSVDPRISHLPFLDGGPWPVIVLTISYVYFAKILGPNLMRDRQPFDLRHIIFGYNVAMVAVNAFILYYGAHFTNFGFGVWGCSSLRSHPRARDDPNMLFPLTVGWVFFMSKFVDFCDTLFFVLRKKWTHVSGLHVFHHAVMPLISWIGLKFVADIRNSGFAPFVNSFIHCIMYTYYALSTLGPKVAQYLWWKRYLTSLQIAQMGLILVHSLHFMFIPGCEYHKVFGVTVAVLATLFIWLFVNFFVKVYINKSSKTLKSN